MAIKYLKKKKKKIITFYLLFPIYINVDINILILVNINRWIFSRREYFN